MDILGITECHYDGILATNLHSFSVKVCVHPSTNFTSLNILDMYFLGGAGGTGGIPLCKPCRFGFKTCIPGMGYGFQGNYRSV